MAITQYQILLLDPSTGDTLALIDGRRIISLRYTAVVNDIGSFQFQIGKSDPAAVYTELLDMIVEVYRKNTPTGNFEKEETYFMRYSETFTDNKNEYVIYGGDSILSMLGWRVINPNDDPLGANDFSTKGGVAETVMREFVTEQCISPDINADRIIAGLTNGVDLLTGQQVFVRKSYENLLLTLQEITVQGEKDFSITRTTDLNWIFEVGIIGSDRSKTNNYPGSPFMYFAPERGNIKNPRLTDNRKKEITVTYVRAQGPEEDRETVLFSLGKQYDSPYNRREDITDAREAEDDATLSSAIITAGSAALKVNQRIFEFVFDINPNAANSQYNVDWFLGDLVSGQYNNIEDDFRIIEVQINIGVGGSETINPILEQVNL